MEGGKEEGREGGKKRDLSMKEMDGMDEQVILAQEKKQDREWEEGEGA